MKALLLSLVTLGTVLVGAPFASLQPAPPQIDLQSGLGKWHSTERFEDEPRISVAIQQNDRSLAGWAVLLGQHRKKDDRATLALSFTEATWTGQAFRFSTILPEDEGTIGWELRVTSPSTAVLLALTENGQPMQDNDLRWEMRRP